MKNLNKSFCFKKKIFDLYYKGCFVCFQSFLSFQDLQNKLGDHKINYHLFNINNFWNLHYPKFHCSNVNTYGIFLRKNIDTLLNSLFSHGDLNIFYILKYNRFYNALYFQNVTKEEKNISSFLSLLSYSHNLAFVFELKKKFIYFLYLLTTRIR